MIPVESKERADIWCNTSETLKGCTTIEDRGRSMADDETDIEKTRSQVFAGETEHLIIQLVVLLTC